MFLPLLLKGLLFRKISDGGLLDREEYRVGLKSLSFWFCWAERDKVSIGRLASGKDESWIAESGLAVSLIDKETKQ